MSFFHSTKLTHFRHTIQQSIHPSTMQCKGPKNGKPNAPKDKGLHCIVCKYRQFKTEQGLSDHFKRQHSIFPCPDCDNIYAATDELAMHRYEAHNKGGLKNKRCLRDSDHLPAPKGKGKLASRPRAASSPAIAEVPVQLCLSPLRPRSTSHAESRRPLAHGCHRTALVPRLPNQVPRDTEQVHAAPRTAHGFRPQAPVFVPHKPTRHQNGVR